MRDIAGKINSVADARYFARKRTPKSIFQLFDAGSGPSITARLNEKAFEEVLFKPRSAVFKPQRDISTCVFGHDIDVPVILSSVGALKAGHQDGELAATRAAGRNGTIQFVSGVTTTPIEEIVLQATGPVYQQIYYIGGREATAPMIERARDAGAAGLVLIADSAAPNVGAEIPYEKRANIPLAMTVKDAVTFLPQIWNRPGWVKDFIQRNGMQMPVAANTRGPDGQPMNFLDASARLYDETPSFDDIPWIREIWDGPIIIKGVVTVESARKAVEHGVTGIVVSNHGGNMLDGTVPSLRVLPEIVDAVGDEIDVIMDGGIRRGTDVVKALAMGAKAVSIGRAYVYGLLAAGEPGVLRIMDLLRTEIQSTLTWLGAASIDELDASMLEIPADWATLTVEELVQRRRSSQSSDNLDLTLPEHAVGV
ncbi:MAG TPA: alpha-hydroxy acid oxidase [Actinomycetes bacterium]|nr:alpha-hydroxy acid oxidase [Actinomycetes bacterium]